MTIDDVRAPDGTPPTQAPDSAVLQASRPAPPRTPETRPRPPGPAVTAAVEGLGYGASLFDPSAALKAEDKEGRELALALGVAAFGAGNVMMFTVPVWAGLFGQELDGTTRQVLYWLAALVATLACFPVAMLRANTRAPLRAVMVWDALVEGAKGALSVAMACACAGIAPACVVRSATVAVTVVSAASA